MYLLSNTLEESDMARFEHSNALEESAMGRS